MNATAKFKKGQEVKWYKGMTAIVKSVSHNVFDNEFYYNVQYFEENAYGEKIRTGSTIEESHLLFIQ
jgi:hypothetical protein